MRTQIAQRCRNNFIIKIKKETVNNFIIKIKKETVFLSFVMKNNGFS